MKTELKRTEIQKNAKKGAWLRFEMKTDYYGLPVTVEIRFSEEDTGYLDEDFPTWPVFGKSAKVWAIRSVMLLTICERLINTEIPDATDFVDIHIDEIDDKMETWNE